MTPPAAEDGLTTILEQDDRWERYHKAAQEKPSKILTLVALTVEDMRVEQKVFNKDFKEHCSEPYDEAHPSPVPLGTETPEGVSGKFTFTGKTVMKIVLVILGLIAGGGALANYIAPMIGG